MHKLFFILFLFVPTILFAQSSNYWSRNFNEESSLLSGAVVCGGSGASAIFYNPASISEIEESKLSLNASLFSVDILNAKNVWGDDLDFYDSRGYVIPRFLSYMIKLKKLENWSFEVAFLNTANFLTESVNYVDKEIDILTHFPGVERYTSFAKYSNKIRDDWFGIGASFNLSERLSLGSSMFVSAKTIDYAYMLDIEAGPVLDYSNPIDFEDYYSAKYYKQEYLRFTDYRILWKFGLLYMADQFSIGVNITTPSIGKIYSDGKRILHKSSQSNITDPETGDPIPNYLIVDYKEKENVNVNAKSPFSISTGITYHNPQQTKTLYITFEYFGEIDPYRLAEANESDNISSGPIIIDGSSSDWLSFVSGAKQIFNVAVGYRWKIKDDVLLFSGFRTDFNFKKNFDYSPYAESKTIKSFDLDKYHITSGITVKVLGQDLITGLQYSFGIERNQKQFVNLSDPVEYNRIEHRALQGTRTNTMNTMSHSISLYFGATINFGGNKIK
jgi:hypothetical protein